MVLDISGSMASGDKMPNLRDAAETFVDTVINDSTRDLVSISIIPYSEHVSAGPAIMSKFNVDWNNPYSHCMEFSDSDFNTSTMRRNKQYDQVQHMEWGSNTMSLNTPVCPVGQHEDIVAFSQDAAALKYKISRLVPRGSTSIFAGMKWAAGLLDPDFNSINVSLAQDGVTDPVFTARPAAFSDRETLKTVILMTDGQNHYSYRINNNYYAKNIVIWSIGFEVTDYSAGVMRDCASSPSHFFRVEGVEIKEAFKAIARQINQLRLTQ